MNRHEWLVAAVVSAALIHCAHAPALKPEQILANVGYDKRLVDCKATAKVSGSFAVYDACERAESRKVCLAHPELRGTWDQCAEVLP